jgi:uncharacterized membrane protein (UPF0127 family)
MYKNVRAYVDEKMFSDKKSVVVGETTVVVDVVDTPEERERGLSGRIELLENEGMLFIFEKLDLHGFWMKDMNFSIDIIWFNEYAEAVHVLENISPNTYPTVFSPPVQAKYVLEVPAGFIKTHGIKLGDTIDLY